MAKLTLTKKQQAALEFIQRYIREHRLSPLIREIQLGCQILSYKSAIDRLNALERKGLIKRTPNKHRGIRLVQKAASVQSNPSADTTLVVSSAMSDRQALSVEGDY